MHTVAHIVTADRSNETLHNVIRTTFVITHGQIERNGWETVGDALASVPGVQIARYGATGTSYNFGIRGSSSSQTLVLIDGTPAPGTFAGSVNLGAFTTQGVDHIEIVEGGGSTLYGTGAIGGIINVITRNGIRPPSASLRLASFGETTTRLSAGNFSYERISAANAFSLPANTYGYTAQPNADFRSTTLQYGSQATFHSIQASWHAELANDDLGVPGPVAFASLSSREEDRNAGVSLLLSRTVGAHATALTLAGSRQTIGYGCAASDPSCFQATQSINVDSRLTLGFRQNLDLATSHLVYGIDLAHGVIRTDSGSVTPGSVATNEFAQTAIYAQDRWLAGKRMQLSLGLRGERDGSLGGEFSPSLGMLMRLTNDLSLKANYASAFRAPNSSELYFPGYGNANLRAERARVADFSLVDDHILGGASLTWFTNTTRDLIVPVLIDPVNFIYKAENLDLASVRGYTFAIQTQRLNGFATSLDVTNLYNAQDVNTGTRLSNDPVFNVGLGLTYHARKSGSLDAAGIHIQSVGARGTVNHTNPLFDQPAAYSQIDAYTRFRLGHRSFISLRGSNLGNERFAQVGGFPMPGRAFSVEFSTR